MATVTVLIFHPAASDSDSELVRVLSEVRNELASRHAAMFREAGASDVRIEREWHEARTFGEVLHALAPTRGGLIVLSGGAVPLLNVRDARRLVTTAASDEAKALTNNRFSSDACAIAQSAKLQMLPPLPTDNALPRWLEEHAGYEVAEMPGRERLGIDLDTPADIALTSLSRSAPGWLREAANRARIAIPRLDDIRDVARDPYAELLIFGRSSSTTLRWLERNVRCRVRFLAEERGMRASSTLAINASADAAQDPVRSTAPRATLGLLLDQGGPNSFAEIVGSLGHGAVVDSRVLLAHRLGADESKWPSPPDRFASDLLRPAEIRDPWLRDLTKSAAASRFPVLLGGHSLVGPGIPLLLR